MKLAIMQPYLFPYIGYFQLLHAVDRFVVYDDVAFIKQGWINRNRILVNGEAAYFTVPLKHASSFTSIRDTLIDDDPQHARWVDRMLKTFDHAYRHAPEFGSVFPLVEAVFKLPTKRISELAVASLKVVAGFLDLPIEWVDSAAVYRNGDLKGEGRVLAICKAEGATDYVNVSGGRELYGRDRFEAAGIRLHFVRSQPCEYPQFSTPFVPLLSIVDVLMFNSQSRARALLEAYDLT